MCRPVKFSPDNNLTNPEQNRNKGSTNNMAVGFQILKQQTGKRGNTPLNNCGVRKQETVQTTATETHVHRL